MYYKYNKLNYKYNKLTSHSCGSTSLPLPSLYWRKQSRLKISMINLIGGKSTYIPPPDSLATLLEKVILRCG